MPKLLLVGYGKMGKAFLAPLENDFEVTVVSPNSKPAPHVPYFPSVSLLKDTFDVVILAVKPWILADVLPIFPKTAYTNNTTFISIITGAGIDYFKQQLGAEARVVRVMPNLNVEVGQGIMAVYPDLKVDYLSKLGRLIYCKEERDIDRFTSFTGSGSGFVFALLEMYQKGSHALEFTTEFDRRQVIIELFEGSLALLKKNQLEFGELKNKVVVPRGTTFEGLKDLSQCEPLIEGSLVRAYHRAVEIRHETMEKLGVKTESKSPEVAPHPSN